MWGIYMIRFSDTKIYIGISKDIDARFKQHSTGRNGAKCLKNKKLSLLYKTMHVFTHRQAAVMEYYLKRISKKNKELIALESPKDLVAFLFSRGILVDKLKRKLIFP